MADLGTMKQDLYRLLRMDSNIAGTSVVTDVTKAIIEAIRFNKNQRFWTNERSHKFVTTSGQFRYPLPPDYLGLASDVFYSPSDDETYRAPLRQRTVDWCEEMKVRGDSWDTAINSGNPDFFAIDEATHEILLVPMPYQDGDQIDFKYVTDMGVPTFKYASSTWNFYQPQSSVALSDTFTNGWFTEYYELVLNRAAYTLFATVYGGTEEATMKAQEHLKLWAEQLNKLRTDASKRSSATSIRRWL